MGKRQKTGCLYEEHYDKGKCRGCTRKTRYTRYVAEVKIDGKRYRHPSMDRQKAEAWLIAVRTGRIPPTVKGSAWME